jgi:flagellar hook-length control protein FliK
MMTQSVMTQTANLFGNATGSVTSKGKQVGSGFDLIIDSNLKSGQKVQGNTEKEIHTDKKTSLHNTKTKNNKSDETDGNANQTKSVTSKDSEKIDDTKSTEETGKQTVKSVDTDKAKETKDEVTEDGQTMAQIAGMLQSIREAVMQTLNLSSEELDQLLMDQGMSVADLLQPEQLQQLVLADKGETDILAALMDEGLAETMKQLLETVDGIKADANLQISQEQLKLLLAKLHAQTGTQEVAEVDIKGSIINSENQMTLAEKLAMQQETINSTNGMKETNELSSSLESQQINSVEGTKLNGTPESSTGTQSDANSKDNQDLKSADQFQIFVDNLVKTQVTKVDVSGNLVQVTELRDIANQIIERIKVSIQPDQTSMELQLNPENLGKVNLSIQSKNGVMTAQFLVQSEISKEAIESQLHILRETLDQQGIKVEAIEVTVSTYAFDQNQDSSDNQSEAQKNNSGNRISLEDAFNMTETDEENAMTEDITGVRGSQVDYTA